MNPIMKFVNFSKNLNQISSEVESKNQAELKRECRLKYFVFLFGGFYFLSSAFSNVTIDVITEVAT